MGDKLNEDKLIAELAKITPAFGRGETLNVNGRPLQLLLVKNPSGFRLSLASANADDYATMIRLTTSTLTVVTCPGCGMLTSTA